MVGGNTLRLCSTKVQASLQTKVPAHPTSTRHIQQPDMPSILGLSHAFEYFQIISEFWEGVPNYKQEVQACPGQAGGPVQAAVVKCGMHWLWS